MKPDEAGVILRNRVAEMRRWPQKNTEEWDLIHAMEFSIEIIDLMEKMFDNETRLRKKFGG